jgi:hypothetical protein
VRRKRGEGEGNEKANVVFRLLVDRYSEVAGTAAYACAGPVDTYVNCEYPYYGNFTCTSGFRLRFDFVPGTSRPLLAPVPAREHFSITLNISRPISLKPPRGG